MLAPGNVLQSRYRIIQQLAKGGMGAVYEALDQRLDATVALKETFFSEEGLRKQFEREARLLARLHHPALPKVSDHFTESDGQFLVMQFIPGDDLEEMLKRNGGAFAQNEVLMWADQLLDALDYLHAQEPPIIHRDIKPSNLKLTARGQIVLLDFGLAKGYSGQISHVTSSGSVLVLQLQMYRSCGASFVMTSLRYCLMLTSPLRPPDDLLRRRHPPPH